MTSRCIKAALVDLSGTLHIENNAICGAQIALKRLREAGIKVKFVTNTTKESKRLLFERLTKLGFDIDKKDIFTSLTAARNLIESRNLRPLLFLEDCAREDFSGINKDNPNAVVIGLSPSSFDYAQMNVAFRLLLDGASLIAIHKNRYYKKSDGLYLGPGPFVSGLEFATGKIAEIVGKPEETFFNEAIRDFNLDPSEIIMIGDDVRDDVHGAMKVGMKGCLVKTGKYRIDDEHTFNPSPSAVCRDFPEAVELVLKDFKS